MLIKLYVSKVLDKGKGARELFAAGGIYNVSAELAREWMKGEPPDAWYPDEERPGLDQKQPEPAPSAADVADLLEPVSQSYATEEPEE